MMLVLQFRQVAFFKTIKEVFFMNLRLKKQLINSALVGGLLIIAPVIHADGYTYITANEPNALFETHASGINNSGQIVGSYLVSTSTTSSYVGFLFSGSTYTTLLDPNSSMDGTFATGINNNGQVIGWYGSADWNANSFLYNGSTYTTLSAPHSLATYARGINDSGQIVGNYLDANWTLQGFLYNGSTYATINVPNATSTSVTGINNSGQMVGNYTDSNGNGHEFVYNGSTYTTINIPSSYELTGINNSGQITGNYFDIYGNLHGFVYYDSTIVSIKDNFYAAGLNDINQVVGYNASIYPTPVPASIWLFGSAIAGFISFHRRKTTTR
jgi:probable HAF family extracellular repeat protein